ncbi:MAG: portal protein [Alphaproteobacteria bacterium]|nr:portal protein [Alphaproteobacteria bacterium]
MTATEALLRAQEKGQLLGPIGGKIQSALARLIEREYGILSRLGFFDADGPVPAPPAARGRNFEVAMTSPLDKARRAEEGVGTMRTLDLASALAAAKPEVMDNIDADATLRGMADINGMPQSFLTDKTQVAEGRRVRAQQQAAQQAVAQVEAAAESAGKAAPAIQAIADARTA